MLETEVRSDRATPYRLWIAACAVSLALVLVPVVGGLLAGVALGGTQAVLLATTVPRVSRVRYLVATVVVTGVGWAAATVPSLVGGGGDAEQPPVLLVALGAIVAGLVLGVVLGTVQAASLRGAVRHPWRWVVPNAAVWPVAVPILVLWPAGGLLAGALVGLVTRAFVPTLSGVSASSRAVLALLSSSRPPGLQRALIGLGVRGRSSGRRYRFPVQYAVAPGGLAVVPGRPSGKTWWRNVAAAPTPVEVLREGVWAPATAWRLDPSDPAYEPVLAAYVERWPDTFADADQPVVLVRLGAAAHP